MSDIKQAGTPQSIQASHSPLSIDEISTVIKRSIEKLQKFLRRLDGRPFVEQDFQFLLYNFISNECSYLLEPTKYVVKNEPVVAPLLRPEWYIRESKKKVDLAILDKTDSNSTTIPLAAIEIKFEKSPGQFYPSVLNDLNALTPLNFSIKLPVFLYVEFASSRSDYVTYLKEQKEKPRYSRVKIYHVAYDKLTEIK